MNKLLFTFSLILLFQFSSACDMCACGVGSAYSGITPNFGKNAIGIRYQHQQASYLVDAVNYNGTSLIESDLYQRSDAYFRYRITKRFQSVLFVPFQIHQRKESLRTTTINGIGDINLIGYYTFVNTGDSLGNKHKNTWYAGAGVKLPTGKYQQRDETKAMLPSLFQIGTGAYAFLLENNYTYRYNNMGINTQVQYRINRENEIGFKLGNQFTATVTAFYLKKLNTFSLLGGVGVAYDHMNQHQNFGFNDGNTGGQSTTANLNVDIYYQQIVVQLLGSVVMNQNLSAAMPQNQYRFGLGFSYFLKD